MSVHLFYANPAIGAAFGAGAADSPPPPPPSVPAWRSGQAVNEWREISGSNLSAVTPTNNPNNKQLNMRMDPWCGLGFDRTRNVVWSLANGGHDDYHGNEVYKLDISVDAPAWVEWFPSDASLSTPYNAARYPSGRPASAHTYYCHQYIAQRDRVIRFGATAASSIGNSFGAVDGWNPTLAQGVNGWDSSSTYPDIPSPDLTEWAVAQDPDTGDVYVFMSNQRVSKWTQASNTWSTVSNGFPPDAFNGRPAAYDTTRDRILCFTYTGGAGGVYTFDPGTGLFTQRTLGGADAAAVTGASSGAGMIYVPALDAYLFRKRAAGATVHRIDAGTFEVTALSTTGGASVPAAPDQSGSNENVYTRWMYVPDYSGVLYVPAPASNAWFLRVH